MAHIYLKRDHLVCVANSAPTWQNTDNYNKNAHHYQKVYFSHLSPTLNFLFFYETRISHIVRFLVKLLVTECIYGYSLRADFLQVLQIEYSLLELQVSFQLFCEQ